MTFTNIKKGTLPSIWFRPVSSIYWSYCNVRRVNLKKYLIPKETNSCKGL